MFGTFYNVIMIVIGSLIGAVLKKGLKEAYHIILMQAMGLVAIGLGINAIVQHLPKSDFPILFIVSLAIGSVIGQMLQLEQRFQTGVARFSKGNLAEGLATAVLLYCIGALSILGPVEAALHGDYTYLLANGTLDGITSIVLASTFGIGIAFSAIAVFLWQGGIYVVTLFMKTSLSLSLMNEIQIIGGILILATGLNILGTVKIKTMNMLPALVIPLVFFMLLHLF